MKWSIIWSGVDGLVHANLPELFPSIAQTSKCHRCGAVVGFGRLEATGSWCHISATFYRNRNNEFAWALLDRLRVTGFRCCAHGRLGGGGVRNVWIHRRLTRQLWPNRVLRGGHARPCDVAITGRLLNRYVMLSRSDNLLRLQAGRSRCRLWIHWTIRAAKRCFTHFRMESRRNWFCFRCRRRRWVALAMWQFAARQRSRFEDDFCMWYTDRMLLFVGSLRWRSRKSYR